MTNFKRNPEARSYDNLIEALNDLKQLGYTEDFNLKGNCIACSNGVYNMLPDEFEIDGYFRLDEEDSSAESASIIYAISSKKYAVRGTLINSFSIYSDDITDAMISKLKFNS